MPSGRAGPCPTWQGPATQTAQECRDLYLFLMGSFLMSNYRVTAAWWVSGSAA
ncbi:MULTISPECIES: hypothetical protein [Streptomyces]|uniref:hypothetical protein n=1 Tax=Streptomyces TaxID=1883 RepID=UPI0029B4BF65|nr:hypothetical protein [Streptomyces sp. WI03-4A]MDX2591556.1 hypothetical protein [Streptomyces sp. WI03-4A]